MSFFCVLLIHLLYYQRFNDQSRIDLPSATNFDDLGRLKRRAVLCFPFIFFFITAVFIVRN